MYIEWVNTIKSSPLFKGIGTESLNTMLECLKPAKKEYRHREIVALQGNLFDGIGVVADGKIALTRETVSGNRIILEILGPGGVFGEMVAFSNIKTWPVTIIAQEDCCILFLPPDKVLGNCSNTCRSHSYLIMNLLNILSNKALLQNKTIEHLSSRTIRGKISSCLIDEYLKNKQQTFQMNMKRNEMADYLGVPRPSLSREMSNMKKDGIIDYNGNQIMIIDLIKLEQSIV